MTQLHQSVLKQLQQVSESIQFMINDQRSCASYSMYVAILLSPLLVLSFFTAQGYAKKFELKGSSLAFSPRLSVMGLYDSNVFYEAPVEANGGVPNHGFFSKFASGFVVENRHKNRVDFNLGADAAYRYYWTVDDEQGRVTQAAIDARNTLDFAKANARLLIGPNSSFNLELQDEFIYIERPVYENTLFGFQRVDNRAGAQVSFAPGSGRNRRGPLELQLKYQLQNIKFLNDGDNLAIQGRSEKVAHITRFVTRWKFLPKNILILDVSYTMNDYNDFQAEEGEDVPEEDLSRDSSPFRAQLGLSGLLSSRIAVFLKGGYANTFNKAGSSFSGLIALLQVSYEYMPRFSLRIGYQRDGQDSGFSNYYILDRYFLKSTWHIARDIRMNAMLSYDRYSYVADNAVDNQGRVDPVLRSDLKISFPLVHALRLQFGWTFEANYTDYTLPVNVPISEATDFAQYQRHLFSIALLFN